MKMEYPDDDYVRATCKIGQGACCCRYLTMGRNGWSCEKLNEIGKTMLDARVERMCAKGDNCGGLGSR